MRNRYSYRHRNAHHRALHPAVIIAICVAAALIVTVVTGLLLKKFLNEDAYRRLVSPKEEEPVVEDPIQTSVPNVHAYAFSLGDDVSTIQPQTAITVRINHANGSLTYHSPVSANLSIPHNESIGLIPCMEELIVKTSYITGTFSVRSFSEETADLRYAASVRERAILREFLRNGGDDVVLTDLSISQDTLPRITEYVTALKRDLDRGAVGVAVPLSVATVDNGWEILSTLLKSCDFCVLDLRDSNPATEEDAVSLLSSLSYYMEKYDARLLADTHQEQLITQLPNARDFMIVGFEE